MTFLAQVGPSTPACAIVCMHLRSLSAQDSAWVQRGLDAGAEALCPGFADMMLYLGGDVGESTFHILHSYHDLKNAHEVPWRFVPGRLGAEQQRQLP